MQRPTQLLYLHGFRSSPKSFKAQRLLAWLAAHQPQVQAWCPQLPPSPREAMALVQAGTADWPASGPVVLGSSLGGFYASWVSRQRGWPAVLINPAVNPARDLAAAIGEQTAFHDPAERFFFHPAYVDELRALTLPPGPPAAPTMGLFATGDEVLDWREMVAQHAGANIRLIEGSDHALSDFDQHLPHILQFLNLCD